ncbi:MAG: MBL fold metallo-hydrolase [Spirochaetales bacterium]|nr:MBL fold metallo-hydrolase [Spirochaetales bacterium]
MNIYRNISMMVLFFLIIIFFSHSQSGNDLKNTVFPKPLQRIDLTDELYVRQIGNGVFVITHSFPWPANSLLVEMEDKTIVIAGSPYTPAATEVILEWIKKYFGPRNIIAINTGFHVDNLGGNETFLKNDIPVYGSDLTVQLLHERGDSTKKAILEMIGDKESHYYKEHKDLQYVPPDHIFPIKKGLDLNTGTEMVTVFYPGPSQAPDKLAVYFPSRKLLFGSCMILSGNKIGNTADADMKQWPVSVRKLFQFPVDVVVPGHGERLDPGLIQHTLDLLAPQGGV